MNTPRPTHVYMSPTAEVRYVIRISNQGLPTEAVYWQGQGHVRIWRSAARTFARWLDTTTDITPTPSNLQSLSPTN